MKKLTIILLVGAIAGAAVFFFWGESNVGGGEGLTARGCTPSTVATASVGHHESKTILVAHSRRAWARIEQPINATSTVFLAFNSGTAATTNSGLMLTTATTTSAVSFIDFGLNTDFPYTGEVTGMSNLGTTTVFVTECRY